ncbi:MAG: pseudouridine-5'-phosphate glycosidase [Alphaproteobacteria bacterium]|nr:pseudouridine-5'-phosphate glycosidase [Alphaproteobacteria bacterium]
MLRIESIVAPDVSAALAAGAPVVALESSLITHGFPRPENLEIALQLEAAVRAGGALPATVGIVSGKVRIGLDEAALQILANGAGVEKCSVRDIGYVCATGGSGGTTVAATARLAASAGIAVLATGGIGGVHRGDASYLDISADLIELGRTRIAVVAAGAKALLDLPATLEALETQGVPVIGYRCGEFPAFYTAESGLQLKHRVDDLSRLARVVATHLALEAGGMLVCNPPPRAFALTRAEVEDYVRAALDEANKAGVTGSAVTPFVLQALGRRSGGRTGAVNRALVIANAELGAALAVAMGVLQ